MVDEIEHVAIQKFNCQSLLDLQWALQSSIVDPFKTTFWNNENPGRASRLKTICLDYLFIDDALLDDTTTCDMIYQAFLRVSKGLRAFYFSETSPIGANASVSVTSSKSVSQLSTDSQNNGSFRSTIKDANLKLPQVSRPQGLGLVAPTSTFGVRHQCQLTLPH
jgi:hypothetical protein